MQNIWKKICNFVQNFTFMYKFGLLKRYFGYDSFRRHQDMPKSIEKKLKYGTRFMNLN